MNIHSFGWKKYLTQLFEWKTMDISFELSMAPSYDYTWLLSFYFVQLSSLQAEILNVKEKIVPIFMVFQLAWILLCQMSIIKCQMLMLILGTCWTSFVFMSMLKCCCLWVKLTMVFFDHHHTLPCEWTNHRAASQLNT